MADQIYREISWDNAIRCRSEGAACASPVRELSHAPPMRLRSCDPIGCHCAVVSAMGTFRFDARARPRSARVVSRFFLREHSTSLDGQVVASGGSAESSRDVPSTIGPSAIVRFSVLPLVLKARPVDLVARTFNFVRECFREARKARIFGNLRIHRDHESRWNFRNVKRNLKSRFLC